MCIHPGAIVQPQERCLAGQPAGPIVILNRVQFIPVGLNSVAFVTRVRLGESHNLCLNVVISSIRKHALEYA